MTHRAMQVAAEGDLADAVDSLLDWAARTSALADAASTNGALLGPGIGSGSQDAAAVGSIEESDSDSEAPAAGRGLRSRAHGTDEGLEAAAAPLVAAAEGCCRAGTGAPKQLLQVTQVLQATQVVRIRAKNIFGVACFATLPVCPTSPCSQDRTLLRVTPHIKSQRL